MLISYFVTFSLLSFFLYFINRTKANSLAPIITSISPELTGSTEGQTTLTIIGTNFAQNGMFSSKVVFVGGEICKIIGYYTTHEKIVCLTPKCLTVACLSDADWQGYEKVTISVYISTIEGILGAFGTFYYNGGYTPSIYQMSHYAWGTSIGQIVGKLVSDQLEDFSVKIGNQFAYLGDSKDTINPLYFDMWSRSSVLLYYPPTDMSAGYYNLSLNVQSSSSNANSRGNGLARMYPVRNVRYNYPDYSYSYNFDISMLGDVVFSVCLLPVITKIYPKQGSIAGGTVIVIEGHGFSQYNENMQVYAAGQLCDVISKTDVRYIKSNLASTEILQCVTRPVNSLEYLRNAYLNVSIETNQSNTIKEYYFTEESFLSSSRSYGSPGWWMKLWDSVSELTDENVRISGGIHEGLFLSFWFKFGSNWAENIGYISHGNTPQTYRAEFRTVLTAPFTGVYYFYINADDDAWLYGSKEEEGFENGMLLVEAHYPICYGNYYPINQPVPRSQGISLMKGEKYLLRVHYQNTYTVDNLEVPMKIVLPGNQTYRDVGLSESFMQFHSLVDVQIIEMHLPIVYEIQQIRIGGVTNGLSQTFVLMIQDVFATVELNFGSTAAEISNALTTAAYELSSYGYYVECYQFSVSKAIYNQGSLLELNITYLVDLGLWKNNPLTATTAFTDDVTNENVYILYDVIQEHTPIPDGKFSLDINFNGHSYIVMADYLFSEQDLISTLQSLSSEIIVNVNKFGDCWTGFNWQIIFLSPIATEITLKVDVTTISNQYATAKVIHVEHGGANSLWFKSIPLSITEAPLSWATSSYREHILQNDILSASNIEVFVSVDSGNVLKAICDFSGTQTSSFHGYIKGSEADCLYHYATHSTAIIFDFSKIEIALRAYEIEIIGNNFLLETASSVSVTVANQECTINFIDNKNIICIVEDIPYGSYVPLVNILGAGSALVTTSSSLLFTPEVYSIYPTVGSITGGQLITIEGKGFHNSTVITFSNRTSPCVIQSISLYKIVCRTPFGPSFTMTPTTDPTYMPTNEPTASPTDEPSATPTKEPTALPTVEPTTIPTNEPMISLGENYRRLLNETTLSPSILVSLFSNSTMIPSTEDPTVLPTTEPTAIPSDIPSKIPSSKPTKHPIASPTMKPTKYPTSKPTKYPTHSPSWKPSKKPSAAPTSKYPTINPSNPSTLPTLQPTRKPSSAPSITPSGPSFSPTFAPTYFNTFELYLDGFADKYNKNQLTYTFDERYTPKVKQINPSEISSAISYNLTITGLKLYFQGANTTVTVGDQSCEHVRLISGTAIDLNTMNDFFYVDSEQTISCVILRNRTFGSARLVDVKVNVPLLGFASSIDNLWQLPSITRGFEISSVLPSLGSVMGGNVLSIQGFGFMPNHPKKHTIVLIEQGLTAFSSYDNLLVALGFPPATIRLDYQELSCNVTFVSEKELICVLPSHIKPFPDKNYTISVNLNSISPECLCNCTYKQTVEYTPVIFSNVEIIDESDSGALTLNLHGTLLSAGDINVWINDVHSTVLNVTSVHGNDTLKVQTNALVAGVHQITANIDGFGFALSYAYIDIKMEIYQVVFAIQKGSIAGGTSFQIIGKGFSSVCKNNMIFINVNYNNNIYAVAVNEFLLCSTNMITALTPSILSYLSEDFSHSHMNSQLNFDAISLSCSINNSNVISNQVDFKVSNYCYSFAGTPLVSTNSTQGVGGDSISVIIFSDFENMDNLVSINIGSEKCIMTIDNAESIKDNSFQFLKTHYISKLCIVPFLHASSIPYKILTRVTPLGYAIANASLGIHLPTFTSRLVIEKSSTIIRSSVKGGLDINILGKGLSSNLLVNICEKPCIISANHISYDSMKCTVPEHRTIDAVDEIYDMFNLNLDLIETISGSYFSSNTNNGVSLNNIYDEDYETYFSDYLHLSCFVGIAIPVGYRVKPYRMRYYPRLSYQSYINNIVFEGSIDGGITYITLADSIGATAGWNYVTVDNLQAEQWYTHLRYRSVDSKSYSYCLLAEIEFLGILAAVDNNCDIDVKFEDSIVPLSAGVLYYSNISSFTPLVERIYPNNGSALGGDVITISGQNFGIYKEASEELLVSFSGVRCEVLSHADTKITCITSPRKPEDIQVSSVVVNIPGRGAAMIADDVLFLYIDNWSSLTSWKDQEPPIEGDIVWIPDGQVLSLDVKTPLLTFLLIEGSLYFNRNYDVSIDSFYIFVLGGYLEIGTADEPFEKSAVITLHGDRFETIEIPMIGAKVIAVAAKGLPNPEPGLHIPGKDQGQLEIHGSKRLRTWTKLNETAYKGNNWIITTEPVDFQVGEKVILTGSEIPGTSNDGLESYDFEELIVLSNLNGHNITFTQSLKYTHFSEFVNFDGRIVDLRCEIGLLSRNVIIQGSEDNSDGQLFGVHTVLMFQGIYRIENAEVRRCGQAFNFGRYCTHSHRGQDMQGSYVKANSIHRSYQRAVTTHDTNNWEVRDNVAFDIMGHAFFMEDGTEKYNYITGNLGVFIRKSSALLMSDQMPAVFWTATPSNFWRDNVACHSAAFGHWFELPSTVGNLAEDESISCPVGEMLGEFRNVTVHSNSGMGLRIYPQWKPLMVPCDTNSEPNPQYLYDLVSHHNGGNGIFSKHHGSLHHIGASIIGNAADEIHISFYENVDYDDNPTFYNVLLVGSINPNFDPSWNLGKAAIYSPQGEYFYVKNATIMKYGTSGALSGCASCLDGEHMAQGGFTQRYEGFKFIQTPKRIQWTETKKEIIWDLDGSIGGLADSMITKSYKFLQFSKDCVILLPQSIYDDSIRCGGINSTARIRRFQVDGVSPNHVSFTDLTIISKSNGRDEIYFLPLDSYGWVFPVVTGNNHTYKIKWSDSGISPYGMTYTLGGTEYLFDSIAKLPRYDDTVRVEFQHNRFEYDPYSFKVSYAGQAYISPLVNKSSYLYEMAQSEYYNSTIAVILSTIGCNEQTANPFQVSLYVKQCPPSGCYIPPPPPDDDHDDGGGGDNDGGDSGGSIWNIKNPLLWSQTSSWPNGRLPLAGERVVINQNMWIVLDINPPRLGSLVVIGKLSFLNDPVNPRSLFLSVRDITIWGSMEIKGINNINDTFIGDATIELYGKKGTSLPLTLGENLFLGAKVIAVVGTLSAKGNSKISWLRISDTINIGDSMICLNATIDWQSGDQIVLSPTGYFKEDGLNWYSGDRTDEILSIADIIRVNNSATCISLANPVKHTHLCTVAYGTKFCGAIGVLTKSIRFISSDSDDSKSYSYGFGASIFVADVSAYRGSVVLENIEFRSFGKLNSYHPAIQFQYSNYIHPPSTIKSCSFNNAYNLVLSSDNSYNLLFENNVAFRNLGGGIFITATNKFSKVINNLIIGTSQKFSVLASRYSWESPIAALTIETSSILCFGNLVAGSSDNGYSIATSVFNLPREYKSVCNITHSNAYTYDEETILSNSLFFQNEAVGCKDGLLIFSMSASESQSDDCAAVVQMKVWRNGHIGILSLDTNTQLLIMNAIIAENHIGMNLHFYKTSVNMFSGIVGSTVIGSLNTNKDRLCNDLSDSVYMRNSQCEALTQNDPLGKITSVCNSVISNIYRRVGILLPQFTNKPRTCAIAGRFTVCDPRSIADRLCALPHEKRYGLPIDIAYAEQHIHNTSFLGFQSRTYSSSELNETTGMCIPQNLIDKSVAIALNPSQIDMQPNIIVSNLQWDQTDQQSRFGFDFGNFICTGRPCAGQNMILAHDLDGSLNVDNVPAQIVFNNPSYAAPYPLCYQSPNLGQELYVCPRNEDSSKEHRQYSGLWRDYGVQVIGPIITQRILSPMQNFTFASYSPTNDMCALRMSFSRYQLLFSVGHIHKIRSTGSLPQEFLIRWDSPFSTDSAVLEFFVSGSQTFQVFVSNNPLTGFKFVPEQSNYPGFNDHAGTNQRNPQKRYLAITIRGGAYRYYKFVTIPTVAVTIKMNMDISSFFADTFIANIALLLGISYRRIAITDVRKGSVIVDFKISPDFVAANSSIQTHSQIQQLVSLTSIIQNSIETGLIEKVLNVTVEQVFTTNPIEEQKYDETYTPPISENQLIDINHITVEDITGESDNQVLNQIIQYQTNIEKVNTVVSEILLTYPTIAPTFEPTLKYNSTAKSSKPTFILTQKPSAQPSKKPSLDPSLVTSKQPSRIPSVYLSESPSVAPIMIPTSDPSFVSSISQRPILYSILFSSGSLVSSSDYSEQPSSDKSYYPTTQPSDQTVLFESENPSVAYSMILISQPYQSSYEPTTLPSQKPSVDLSMMFSAQTNMIPTMQPSIDISTVPTISHSDEPTVSTSHEPSIDLSMIFSVQTNMIPTMQPSIDISTVPTISHSDEPTTLPSQIPSVNLSMMFSAQTNMIPTMQPSIDISTVPTISHSDEPTVSTSHEPSIDLSMIFSVQTNMIPTMQPSIDISTVPTISQSDEPTVLTSHEPSIDLSMIPTMQPSIDISTMPTSSQSYEPSALPSQKPSVDLSMIPTMHPSIDISTVPTISHSDEPSALPSQKPSVDLSMIPTMHPSIDISTVPTISHSDEPSAKQVSIIPTLSPTIETTFMPSLNVNVLPSNNPTFHPSSDPSIEASSAPTNVLSSSIPTIIFESTKVTFSCATSMAGMSSDKFDTSSQDAFASTIESLSNQDGVTTSVIITSYSDSNSRIRKYNIQAASLIINYDTILTILKTSLTSSVDANAAYNLFIGNMNTALSSGSFLAALKKSGISSFANITIDPNSFSASTPTIVSVGLSPSFTPTSSVQSGKTNNSQQLLIGVVVGLVCALLLLFGIIYYKYFYTKASMINEGEDLFSPMTETYFDDLETLSFDKIYPDVNDSTIVIRTLDGTAEINYDNEQSHEIVPPLPYLTKIPSRFDYGGVSLEDGYNEYTMKNEFLHKTSFNFGSIYDQLNEYDYHNPIAANIRTPSLGALISFDSIYADNEITGSNPQLNLKRIYSLNTKVNLDDICSDTEIKSFSNSIYTTNIKTPSLGPMVFFDSIYKDSEIEGCNPQLNLKRMPSLNTEVNFDDMYLDTDMRSISNNPLATNIKTPSLGPMVFFDSIYKDSEIEGCNPQLNLKRIPSLHEAYVSYDHFNDEIPISGLNPFANTTHAIHFENIYSSDQVFCVNTKDIPTEILPDAHFIMNSNITYIDNPNIHRNLDSEELQLLNIEDDNSVVNQTQSNNISEFNKKIVNDSEIIIDL